VLGVKVSKGLTASCQLTIGPERNGVANMGCGRCRGPVRVKGFEAPRRAPVLNKDGDIVFPLKADVPKLEGYTAHPEQPHVLSPNEDFVCENRMTGILLQKDGSYAPTYICMDGKCPHKSTQVNPSICKACPFRSA